MSISSSKNTVYLKSCDGEIFEVDKVVISESLTIKQIIESAEDVAGKFSGSAIDLQNVTTKTLAKVIEYCKKHVLASESEDPRAVAKELKAFDVEFMHVDEYTLFYIMMAANYLNIEGLLNLACKRYADIIADKTPEEIREFFGIKYDFSPQEEEENRSGNKWRFE